MEKQYQSMINTKVRSSQIEIMDDFLKADDELEVVLSKIAKINDVLGGNRITLDGLKKLLRNQDKKKPIKIIDIGCGNGDMLRKIAEFGYKKSMQFELIGLDANNYTIDCARKVSKQYNNITFECRDVFNPDFFNQKFDIALCTLTLHHFSDEEIEVLLSKLQKNTKLGIIVNDLQRSKIAYHLFQLYCLFSSLNGMAKADGLVSILRGFKRKELEKLSEKLNLQNDQIHWKWAFRYQWIIPTL